MVFGWPVQPSVETMTYSDRPFLGHHLLDRHGDDHQEEEEEEMIIKRRGRANVQELSLYPLQKLVWIKTLMLVGVSGDNVKLERGLLLLLFRNSSILCF